MLRRHRSLHHPKSRRRQGRARGRDQFQTGKARTSEIKRTRTLTQNVPVVSDIVIPAPPLDTTTVLVVTEFPEDGFASPKLVEEAEIADDGVRPLMPVGEADAEDCGSKARLVELVDTSS